MDGLEFLPQLDEPRMIVGSALVHVAERQTVGSAIASVLIRGQRSGGLIERWCNGLIEDTSPRIESEDLQLRRGPARDDRRLGRERQIGNGLRVESRQIAGVLRKGIRGSKGR